MQDIKLGLVGGWQVQINVEGKLSRNDGIVKSGCGIHKAKKGKGSYDRKQEKRVANW